MHYHSEALIRDLSARAQTFRINTLKMVFNAQSGHIGGAFRWRRSWRRSIFIT